MQTNIIHPESCLTTMSSLDDHCIDMVITSPPYDDMRSYNGYVFDPSSIIPELCRVTKIGGAIVWVVGDKTENGGESGSSFKQALKFIECGCNMETMIWEKPSAGGCLGSKKLYGQVFEYMFVFFNKAQPATHNLICDRKNINPHKLKSSPVGIDDTGMPRKYRKVLTKEYGKRTNVWKHARENKNGHPAPFPLQIAKDHIVTWSNENDIVYDPFMGSGTTAVACVETSRKYVGSEISSEYCKLIHSRIAKTTPPLF